MRALAVLYLLLGAEFIATAQMIVYAGAIMVLFIFVIMLLNAGAEERPASARSIALILGVPALDRAARRCSAYFVAALVPQRAVWSSSAASAAARPQDIGSALFTDLPAALRSHLGPDPDRHSRRDRAGAKGDGLNATPDSRRRPDFLVSPLSAILFALGVAGFLFRRNIITVFMSIELMLNAVNLSFVTFSYQLQAGETATSSRFFVMVVAAAEAAVGLAIILTVFKNRATLNIDEVNSHEELA